MEFTLNTRHKTGDEWTGFPYAVESLIRVRTADAVFVVDPEYRIVHWDDRAESLTGFLTEEVVGRPCYEVVSAQGGIGDCFDARVRSAMKLARTRPARAWLRRSRVDPHQRQAVGQPEHPGRGL